MLPLPDRPLPDPGVLPETGELRQRGELPGEQDEAHRKGSGLLRGTGLVEAEKNFEPPFPFFLLQLLQPGHRGHH